MTTKTAYHAGLVVEMVGDVSVLEQIIPWNANCAQMGQRAATLVKPPEISTPEALNMSRTIEAAVQIPLCLSQVKEHQGREGQYTAKVTANIRDCLTRQVREAVEIRRCEVLVLNGKTEWHQPALCQIQNEIYRG